MTEYALAPQDKQGASTHTYRMTSKYLINNMTPQKTACRWAGLASAFAMLAVCPLLAATSAEPAADIPVLIADQTDANGNPLPATPTTAGIINLLAAESGLNLVMHAYPWRRAQMRAENGEGFLYGAGATPERLRVFNFTKPVYFSNQWLVTSARNPLNFQRWEDLRGKVISIASGERFGAEFEEHRGKLFTVEENAATISSRLKMLNMGRVDAVLLDSYRTAPQLEAKLNCMFPEIGKWTVAEKPLDTEPVLIAISKASPLNSILAQLNDTIDRLSKSRDIQKLLEKKSASPDC